MLFRPNDSQQAALAALQTFLVFIGAPSWVFQEANYGGVRPLAYEDRASCFCVFKDEDMRIQIILQKEIWDPQEFPYYWSWRATRIDFWPAKRERPNLWMKFSPEFRLVPGGDMKTDGHLVTTNRLLTSYEFSPAA